MPALLTESAMAGLRLIVGLGNPGPEHARTRHNAGFWFLDALAEKAGARFGLESKLHGETARIDLAGQTVTFDGAAVRDKLSLLTKDVDLSRFIL